MSSSSGAVTRTGAPPPPLQLRLVTFNVRYATKNRAAREQPWRVRCPKLCSQLRFVTTGHDGAFLCLQEVLYEQLLDIQAQLGGGSGSKDDNSEHSEQEWAYIGQGRDDGKTEGEFSPIFYRPRVWRCEQSRVYWLSETPERPSRGWDAMLNRIVTVGLFRHRATGQRAVVMSTHFDHLGVQARQESARLILCIADAWGQEQEQEKEGGTVSGTTAAAVSASSPSRPIFLGGDFNSTPDDGAYKTMTAVPGGMVDVSGLLPSAQRYGNDEFTYTSFGEPYETPNRIDFLFVKDPCDIRFLTFAVLANQFDDGVFLSDHRAVVADVELAHTSSTSTT